MQPVTISLDSETLSAVDQAAKEQGMSRSRLIQLCIAAYLEPKEAVSGDVAFIRGEQVAKRKIRAVYSLVYSLFGTNNRSSRA
jgi:metal-responsive CopG/Arc/MetJ family transcriptional regulator